ERADHRHDGRPEPVSPEGQGESRDDEHGREDVRDLGTEVEPGDGGGRGHAYRFGSPYKYTARAFSFSGGNLAAAAHVVRALRDLLKTALVDGPRSGAMVAHVLVALLEQLDHGQDAVRV